MGDVKRTRLLIIGSGPAGYTAAVYGARAMLKPLLVEGLQPGGQLTITTDVENWPGETAIMGPDLMAKLRAQAEHVGTEILSDIIAEVDFTQRPFRAVADSGLVIEAETVVIATGASARWLGLESETRLRGKGVSACATCDGFFFRGKHVAVVGGGNTAVEEALFLTNFASKVTLIHRRDELRADKTNQARLFANPKIEMVWNATVSDVIGADGVSGIVLTDTVTGATRPLAIRPAKPRKSEFGRFTRQVSGYCFEHLLPENGRRLERFLVGSEGTLGVVLDATVRLVADAPFRALAVLGYASMADAADAVPPLVST